MVPVEITAAGFERHDKEMTASSALTTVIYTWIVNWGIMNLLVTYFTLRMSEILTNPRKIMACRYAFASILSAIVSKTVPIRVATVASTVTKPQVSRVS